MTAKKRYLKSSEEFSSKPSVSNDLDISWSSCSSEKGNSPPKKFKSNHYFKNNLSLVNAWIKIGQPPEKSKGCSSDDNSLNICSQFTATTTCCEDVYDKPSISSNHTFEESPIIGSLKLGEVSPVLGFTHNKLIVNSSPSPVIGKGRTSTVISKRLNKVRRIVKDDEDEEFSPKLFQTNSTEQTEVMIKGNLLKCSQIINNKHINSKSKRLDNYVHQFKLRSESKCLYSTQQSETFFEIISPSLSKVSSLNKASENITNNDLEPLEFKPDLFSIYPGKYSDTIIESNSPSASQKTDLSIASEQSCHNPLNYTIDPFLSQECAQISPNTNLIETPTSQELLFDVDSSQTPNNKSSDSIINTDSTDTSNEVKTITESTETSSTKSSNVEPLYHEVIPKRKKRYKKDGLADLLQKALHKQKIDFAIWRHELYLKKTKKEASILTNEIPVLMFKINKFWKEFGVMVVECECIKDQSEEIENENFDALEDQNVEIMRQMNDDSVNDAHINSKKCLVIIGFNVTHSLRIKINAKFKLCMPYKTKIVKYSGESIFCYFNVSKLLSFK